jgi:tripartite-type tricarboxylate transporter receptor subunit TctC
MRRIAGLFLITALAAASFAASAQQYPTRPIRVIVPFPPGGLTDVSARVIANGMTQLGQPVVIENRPGGNTLIGIRTVVDASPDGYTIGYAASSITLSAATSKSWDVDPVRQLTPISQAVEFPLAIAISPKKYPNVRTLAEFVALAKAAAGKFNFAMITPNGGDAILVKQLARAGGFDGAYILYKGGVATTQAVMSGEADATTVAPQTAIGIVQQGSLRLLGITGEKRFRMLPDVPTMAESGYPGVNLVNWFGFVGPARLPPDIVATLHSAIAASLRSTPVQKALVDSGTDIVASSPQEFAARIASELAASRKMVADGIVPQGE